MPANRMLHKRAGSGERTNALTHLEFRAWIIYRLAADDFGVLRFDVGSLVEAHPCLSKEKTKAVAAALERLISVGLCHRFTAQGLIYLYSRDWQDFEKIEWPQITTRPKPPASEIDQCSEETQRLFSAWPGGERVAPAKERSRKSLASSSQVSSESVASNLRPHANANAQATASESENGRSGFHASPDAAGAFLEGYRERYQRVTGGSLPLVWSAKDVAIATELLQTWPLPRLLDMAELFMHRTDRDVAGKPKTVPFFKPLAPWCDARLREAGR